MEMSLIYFLISSESFASLYSGSFSSLSNVAFASLAIPKTLRQSGLFGVISISKTLSSKAKTSLISLPIGVSSSRTKTPSATFLLITFVS